jgi:hypothetical protein
VNKKVRVSVTVTFNDSVMVVLCDDSVQNNRDLTEVKKMFKYRIQNFLTYKLITT